MFLFLHSPKPSSILLHSADTISLGNINSSLFALLVYETEGNSFLTCDLNFMAPILDLRAKHSSPSAKDIVLLRIWQQRSYLPGFCRWMLILLGCHWKAQIWISRGDGFKNPLCSLGASLCCQEESIALQADREASCYCLPFVCFFAYSGALCLISKACVFESVGKKASASLVWGHTRDKLAWFPRAFFLHLYPLYPHITYQSMHH